MYFVLVNGEVREPHDLNPRYLTDSEVDRVLGSVPIPDATSRFYRGELAGVNCDDQRLQVLTRCLIVSCSFTECFRAVNFGSEQVYRMELVPELHEFVVDSTIPESEFAELTNVVEDALSSAGAERKQKQLARHVLFDLEHLFRNLRFTNNHMFSAFSASEYCCSDGGSSTLTDGLRVSFVLKLTVH